MALILALAAGGGTPLVLSDVLGAGARNDHHVMTRPELETRLGQLLVQVRQERADYTGQRFASIDKRLDRLDATLGDVNATLGHVREELAALRALSDDARAREGAWRWRPRDGNLDARDAMRGRR